MVNRPKMFKHENMKSRKEIFFAAPLRQQEALPVTEVNALKEGEDEK